MREKMMKPDPCVDDEFSAEEGARCRLSGACADAPDLYAVPERFEPIEPVDTTMSPAYILLCIVVTVLAVIAAAIWPLPVKP